MNSETRALILTELIIAGLKKLAEMGAVLTKSRAEGRDVTPEELAAFDAQYDAARAKGDAILKALNESGL